MSSSVPTVICPAATLPPSIATPKMYTSTVPMADTVSRLGQNRLLSLMARIQLERMSSLVSSNMEAFSFSRVKASVTRMPDRLSCR